MERKRILINNILPREGLTDLFSLFEVIAPEDEPLSREEVLEKIPQCHGVIPAFFQVDKEILDKAENLEIISNFGAGYDNIDVEYATKKGIMVTNIPETVTEATAELTLGLILSLVRRITEGDRRLRNGNHTDWGKPTGFLGTGLAGKTLAIIGMGRIGLAVAKLAQAFGMKVVYNKRTPYSSQEENQFNIKFLPLSELIENGDIISLHCPLTPETHHLLGEKEFANMKPTSVVINTARGPVIDEKALLQALVEKQIAGAAIDVFEFEPQITQGLLEQDNVVLTPHIGSSTLETRVIMTKACVQHLLDYFSGKNPTHIVNRKILNKI